MIVYLLLDIGQFRWIDRSEMREIEAQPVRRHQRTRLLHVRAQDIAQRGVHQMRPGMVAFDVFTSGSVGDYGDTITNMQIFLRNDTVGYETRYRIVGAVYLCKEQ